MEGAKNKLIFLHKEKGYKNEIDQVNFEKKEYKDKLYELESKLEETVYDMKKIAEMTQKHKQDYKFKRSKLTKFSDVQ